MCLWLAELEAYFSIVYVSAELIAHFSMFLCLAEFVVYPQYANGGFNVFLLCTAVLRMLACKRVLTFEY